MQSAFEWKCKFPGGNEQQQLPLLVLVDVPKKTSYRIRVYTFLS